jgi:hypothetical protein
MHLKNLLNWYEYLTPASLEKIEEYYAIDASFKDPFNEVHDIASIRQIFVHMFATTKNARFVFEEVFEKEQQAFVTWLFHFELQGKSYAVQGCSHLKFNKEGLVSEHRDYWDAAEELWQKLPLIGKPVRWLRTKFKAN